MKEFNEWFKSQYGEFHSSDIIGYYNTTLAAWSYQQAKIDALMLEYCPEEMTEDQLEEWKKSQKVFKE